MEKIFQGKILQVRLIQKEKVTNWEGYLKNYLYLGYKWIIGETLRYVSFLD